MYDLKYKIAVTTMVNTYIGLSWLLPDNACNLFNIFQNSGEIVSLNDPKLSVQNGMRESVVSLATQAEIKAKEEAYQESLKRQVNENPTD